ncbi:MAG: GIY-YIG nuclease family protein [bacterium]
MSVFCEPQSEPFNNVLYIGVTNNLIRRVYEHKRGLSDGFTKKYHCHMLEWFQQT